MERVKLAVGAQQPLAQTRGLEPVTGDIADAHDGAPAHRAAIELERPAGEAFDVEVKGFSARPQSFDAGFELLGRIRRQPGAEAENAPRDRLVGDEAQIAFNLGFMVRAVPGDDDLRLGREKDLRAIEFGAHIVEFERIGRVLLLPFARFAQVQKRGDRGEHDKADEQREAENVLIGLQMLEHERGIARLGESGRRGAATWRAPSKAFDADPSRTWPGHLPMSRA